MESIAGSEPGPVWPCKQARLPEVNVNIDLLPGMEYTQNRQGGKVLMPSISQHGGERAGLRTLKVRLTAKEYEAGHPARGKADLADKPAGQRAEAHAKPRKRHGVVKAVNGHEVLVDQDEAGGHKHPCNGCADGNCLQARTNFDFMKKNKVK